MLAQRKVSVLAVVTFHTGQKRRAGNPVSHFYLGNAFPDFHHITGEFVSQNNGIKMYAIVENSRNIRAADPGGFYLYFHIARPNLWFLHLLITNVFICNLQLLLS